MAGDYSKMTNYNENAARINRNLGGVDPREIDLEIYFRKEEGKEQEVRQAQQSLEEKIKIGGKKKTSFVRKYINEIAGGLTTLTGGGLMASSYYYHDIMPLSIGFSGFIMCMGGITYLIMGSK
ncbi:hypothetical protein HZA33_00665 [Candidatus Pacearchaeota archaeon]|nr:hypothetical protein [Candidatus Pacearchaeota archaeon]